jgi:DNA-binding CsgD family transcriptional regulator/tetratricopeptide (TPR) repeat protein
VSGLIFTRAPLVNRVAELAAMRERLGFALASRGSSVLLAGPTGIGKSRLLEEAVELARLAGFRSAISACFEFMSAPFGPVTDLMRALNAEDPGIMDDRDRAALDSIIDIRSDRANSPWSLNAELAQIIRKHAQSRPLLLAVEDIQWGDQATLDLIAYLRPALRSLPVLLIETVRTDSFFAPGVTLSALSDRYPSICDERIELGPLDVDDTVRVVETATDVLLDPLVVGRIVSMAEGNPLYARELARSAAMVDPDGSSHVPHSVAASILKRLGQLSEPQVRVLTVAAVIGRTFGVELVRDSACVEESLVDGALEDARSLQLICESSETAGAFAFHHEIVREIIITIPPMAELRRVHRTVAEHLAHRPRNLRNVIALAHHCAKAADAERAIEFSELAGDEALILGSPGDAVNLFEQALEFARKPSARRLRLLRKLASSYSWGGHHERALTLLQEALNYARSSGDAAAIAEVSLAIGTQLENQPRADTVLATRMEALGAVQPSANHALYLGALIGVADAYNNRGEPELAQPYIGKAAENLASAGPDVRARYFMVRGATLAALGEPQAALESIRDAMEWAEETGDARFPVWVRLNCCHYATTVGSVEIASMSAVASMAIADESSNPSLIVYAYAYAAAAALLAGDVGEATARVGRARDAMRESSSPRLISVVASTALSIALRQGGADMPWLPSFDDDRLLEAAFRSEASWWIGSLVAALFEWRSQSRSKGAALHMLLHRAISSVASVGFCVQLPLVVASHGSLEDIAIARNLIARWASGRGNQYGRACQALFEAMVAARRGSSAEEAALGAGAAFAQLRIPLLRAKAFEVAARRDEAALEYRLCGATADVKRLSPNRVPVASAKLRETLSIREREVADVLLKGHSNREIADLLHISERTVESHVRTILSKTGVRSRFELAMVLVEDEGSAADRHGESLPAS